MYEREILSPGIDDGTMEKNVNDLSALVVGHRIVAARRHSRTFTSLFGLSATTYSFILTLDNGTQVELEETSDCCAYTELLAFLRNVDSADHITTGVGTTDGYTKWHIYADMGDVLEMTVDWSAGDVGAYAYGFNVKVKPLTTLPLGS